MGDDVVKLYTDGACRGNPGIGGAGAVLIDSKGNTLATCRKFLGICTNNEAEYQALILGLEEALKNHYRRLQIYMDSELLVKQINGAYQVKSPQLKTLMQEVKRLLSFLDEYVVEHIRRNLNSVADQLANEAIDKEPSV
jgi:ribonuclease HI